MATDLRKVDVAINVYGKPMQTAVTLLTLLKHSGEHIDRIWFIEERKQPYGADFQRIRERFASRVVHVRPAFWPGVRHNGLKWLYRFGPYRRSVLFQAAWEASAKPFLFITHNDVLYRGDIVGAMLDRIEGHIAVGLVGQCWNCSAHHAGVCDPERFMQYRPTFAEWLRISTMHPGARSDQYEWVMDARRPWPLPECRVNEWSMLVDLHKAKPVTMPHGPAIPLGAVVGVDVGTRWFHDVITAGHRVRHMEIAPYAHHAWASTTGGGNPALTDKSIYDREEGTARLYLAEHFPDHLA